MFLADNLRNDFSETDYYTAAPHLIAAYRSLGFYVQNLNGMVWAQKNGQSTFNKVTETNFNGQTARALIKNKEWAKRVLSAAGISVAKGKFFEFAEQDSAREFCKKIEPAVVKPVDGNQGKGVTVNVTSANFDAAWAKAVRATRTGVIVERYFSGGTEARYLAIDGKCVAVFLRLPPYVIGDGKHTIEELVAKTNDVRTKNPCRKKYLIDLHEEQIEHLAKSGHGLETIPDFNQTITLDLKAGPGTGGDAVNITDQVHPTMIDMVESISRAIPEIHVLGADILATDHTQAATSDNYIVMEANTNPRPQGHQFPDFGEPIDVFTQIVESCVKKMGLGGDIPPSYQKVGSIPAKAQIAHTPEEMTLVFAGDTSLGDNYILNRNDEALKRRLQEAPESFFEKIRPLISDKSHFVLNFESVLASNPDDLWNGQKNYLGIDDPSRTIPILNRIGVDSVSLANNHSMDFGTKHLLSGMQKLRSAGINVFGVGRNRRESSLPLILSTEIGNVYVVGGFEYRASYHKNYGVYSSVNQPGIQPFRQQSENQLADEIRELRDMDPESFIIAFPHWGGSQNYRWISEKMLSVNSSFLQAGADLVLGHGSHMMQQCWVEDSDTSVFSLGNFVFNSPGRYKKLQAPPYSLVARLNLQRSKGKWATRLRLYPIVTDNRATQYQTRPVDEKEALQVFDTLADKGQRIFQQSFSIGQDDKGFFIERSGPVSRRCVLL